MPDNMRHVRRFGVLRFGWAVFCIFVSRCAFGSPRVCG